MSPTPPAAHDPTTIADGSAVVILAAGEGKRMRSDLAKVLHPLAGAPLLEHVLDACVAAGLARVHVVVGHQADQVRAVFAGRDVVWAHQPTRRGTADAVRCALPALGSATRVLSRSS